MLDTILRSIVILFIASMGLLVKSGIDEINEEQERNIKLVQEISKNFIQLYPQVSSLEFWRYVKKTDEWVCLAGAGQFDLCELTTSYPDDEWAEKTTIIIAIDGVSIKSIDNNPEFAAYVEIIGEGYYFVKFDTPSGNTRVTFITKEPILAKEMKAIVNRWAEYIDKL